MTSDKSCANMQTNLSELKLSFKKDENINIMNDDQSNRNFNSNDDVGECIEN